MANRDEVSRFLEQWRRVADEFIYFVPRAKNLEGMKELNLTVTLARKMLQDLALENYVKGPGADRDGSGQEVWVFGIKMENHEIYIKIKIFEFEGKFHAKCLSFHPAEFPLRYPFAGGDSS